MYLESAMAFTVRLTV